MDFQTVHIGNTVYSIFKHISMRMQTIFWEGNTTQVMFVTCVEIAHTHTKPEHGRERRDRRRAGCGGETTKEIYKGSAKET